MWLLWEIVKLESDRKNLNEEAQVLSIDGKFANNQQTVANAFNEYFLSLVEKKSIDYYYYDNGNDNSNNRDNNDNVYTPVHHLLNAVNNSFPNIKLNSTTTQEIENSIKSFTPKNRFGYDESPTNVLKISTVYICSPLNHIFNTSLS